MDGVMKFFPSPQECMISEAFMLSDLPHHVLEGSIVAEGNSAERYGGAICCRHSRLTCRLQAGTLRLKLLRQPVVCLHWSHFLISFCHRNDKGNPTDVTRRCSPQLLMTKSCRANENWEEVKEKKGEKG